MSQSIDPRAFGRWRELLHEPHPTTRTWRALHRMARRAARDAPDVFIEQWAPYAERLLARWPAELRAWSRDVALELAASDAPEDRALLRLGSGACLRTTDEVRLWHRLTGGLPVVELSPPEDHLDPDALVALLPLLVGTAALRLRDQAPLSAASVAALVTWPGLDALRVLDLRGNPAGLDVIEALAHTRAAPPLLEVVRVGPYQHGATIPWPAARGDALVAALAAATLPALRALDLTSCGLSDAAVAALCDAPGLSTLTTLRLEAQEGYDWNRSTGLSDAAMRHLASSPHLTGLAALHLGYNQLTGDGLAAWGASANARALRELSLSGRSRGDDLIDGLSRAPSLDALETLRLNYVVELTLRGLLALADSPCGRSLRVLELRGDLIRPDMLKALAELSVFPALTTLSFHTRHLSTREQINATTYTRVLLLERPTLTLTVEGRTTRGARAEGGA